MFDVIYLYLSIKINTYVTILCFEYLSLILIFKSFVYSNFPCVSGTVR